MSALKSSHYALIAATCAAWFAQVLYLVMPLDLLPDFVPLLGFLDDAVGMAGAIGLTWYTGNALRDAGLLTSMAPKAVDYEPIDEGTLRAL